MEINLGERPVANVKMGASTYRVEVPTVKQAIAFKDKVDGAKDGKEGLIFLDFLTKLGMPEDAVETLSLSQLTKLAEGLLGDAKKK